MREDKKEVLRLRNTCMKNRNIKTAHTFCFGCALFAIQCFAPDLQTIADMGQKIEFVNPIYHAISFYSAVWAW